MKDETVGAEAKKTFDDAMEMLNEIVATKSLQAPPPPPPPMPRGCPPRPHDARRTPYERTTQPTVHRSSGQRAVGALPRAPIPPIGPTAPPPPPLRLLCRCVPRQAKGVIAFYPANSVGDDIEVYESDAARSTPLKTFYTLRQQADTDSDVYVQHNVCTRSRARTRTHTYRLGC